MFQINTRSISSSQISVFVRLEGEGEDITDVVHSSDILVYSRHDLKQQRIGWTTPSVPGHSRCVESFVQCLENNSYNGVRDYFQSVSERLSAIPNVPFLEMHVNSIRMTHVTAAAGKSTMP